jgi:hypothetical protein
MTSPLSPDPSDLEAYQGEKPRMDLGSSLTMEVKALKLTYRALET